MEASKKICISILCKREPTSYAIYERLIKGTNISLEFISDDFHNLGSEIYCGKIGEFNFTIHSFSDNKVAEFGYINATPVDRIKNPCAWDKALYRYCLEAYNLFDYVWLIEEDVFLPSGKNLQSLIKKMERFEADLFCKSHDIKEDYEVDKKTLENTIEKHRRYSMTCAVGLSKTLLSKIREFVEKSQTLYNHEYLFNTIAECNNLVVSRRPEMQGIYWKAPTNTTFFEVLKESRGYMFHPIKRFSAHKQLLAAYEELDKPLNTE